MPRHEKGQREKAIAARLASVQSTSASTKHATKLVPSTERDDAKRQKIGGAKRQEKVGIDINGQEFFLKLLKHFETCYDYDGSEEYHDDQCLMMAEEHRYLLNVKCPKEMKGEKYSIEKGWTATEACIANTAADTKDLLHELVMLGANITDRCYDLLLGLGEDDWYSKDVTFVGGENMIAILLSGYIPSPNDNTFVLDELVLRLENYEQIDYEHQNDEEGLDDTGRQRITGEFLHILYKLAIKRGRGVDVYDIEPKLRNYIGIQQNDIGYCCGRITEAVLRNINSLPTMKAGKTHKEGGPLDRLMKLFPKDTIELHWHGLEIAKDMIEYD